VSSCGVDPAIVTSGQRDDAGLRRGIAGQVVDDQFDEELLHALPRVGRKGFGVDKAKRIQGIMSTVGIEDLCTVGQLGSKQRQALLELVDDWY